MPQINFPNDLSMTALPIRFYACTPLQNSVRAERAQDGSAYPCPGAAEAGVAPGYPRPRAAEVGVASGYPRPGAAEVGVASRYPCPGAAEAGVASGYPRP